MCLEQNINPHVARNDKRKGGSAIDNRTSRHSGYEASQKVRKRIEEGFGWGKTVGLIRQVKVRGLKRVNAVMQMTFIGWNLTRMRNLQEQCACWRPKRVDWAPDSPKTKKSSKHTAAAKKPQVAIDEDASKDDLYQLAAKLEIPGRSRMSKAELITALHRPPPSLITNA